MSKTEKRPKGGETWQLRDGRWVTIIGKSHGSYKIVNPDGKLEVVFDPVFKSKKETH
jgi:hypothetical protein